MSATIRVCFAKIGCKPHCHEPCSPFAHLAKPWKQLKTRSFQGWQNNQHYRTNNQVEEPIMQSMQFIDGAKEKTDHDRVINTAESQPTSVAPAVERLEMSDQVDDSRISRGETCHAQEIGVSVAPPPPPVTNQSLSATHERDWSEMDRKDDELNLSLADNQQPEFQTEGSGNVAGDRVLQHTYSEPLPSRMPPIFKKSVARWRTTSSTPVTTVHGNSASSIVSPQSAADSTASSQTAHFASVVAAAVAGGVQKAADDIESMDNKIRSTNILKPFPRRSEYDEMVVGLKNYGLKQSFMETRTRMPPLPSKTGHESRTKQSSKRSEAEFSVASSKTLKTATQPWVGARINYPIENTKKGAVPCHSSSNHAYFYGATAKLQHHGDSATPGPPRRSVEEMEQEARRTATMNPFALLFLGNVAAVKVMIYYLITWETIISCALTAGMTLYWYDYGSSPEGQAHDFTGTRMDFILLAFAVTSPIIAALQMAYARRERALIAVADFRSFSHHLFLAHCIWDWPENGGRMAAATEQGVDWIEHCDAVMAQLIGIGDELGRFLTLPSASRSRHKFTTHGRKEAARTMEVAYYLLESMSTQRISRLMLYSERLKKIGLPAGEVSRIRQYERFLSNNIEQLRMVKLYRTPLALRSFARIFTVLLPPFYAPSYAQVAINVNSLGVGIAFGIIAALGLTALFEGVQVLEDPFTAFLALDGIDVREEFEVLHFAQLVNTRKLLFPDAPYYPVGRRCALTGGLSSSKRHLLGMPPIQNYHERHHAHHNSVAPSVLSSTGTGQFSATREDDGDIALDGVTRGDEEVDVGPLSRLGIDLDHVDVELGTHIVEDDEAMMREPFFAGCIGEEAFRTSRSLGHSERSGGSHRRVGSINSFSEFVGRRVGE